MGRGGLGREDNMKVFSLHAPYLGSVLGISHVTPCPTRKKFLDAESEVTPNITGYNHKLKKWTKN